MDDYTDTVTLYETLLHRAQQPVRDAIRALGHGEEDAQKMLDKLNKYYGCQHMLFLQRLLSCQPNDLE